MEYGPRIVDGGVEFRVHSRDATAMRVLLYDRAEDRDPARVLDMDPARKIGTCWTRFVGGIGPGQLYLVQCDGPHDPLHGYWFNGKARLIDPYAQALVGDFQPNSDGILRPPKCLVVDHKTFDWQDEPRPRRAITDQVIYECHVRGFTRSKTSLVKYPGTYLGLIEKIPYLQQLGVTAVELMPVTDFPLSASNGLPPVRPNYWGYDPLAFFAPHRGYAASPAPGAQVHEFKQLVKALHKADIEVFMDVVFNHTAEGNHEGPVLSLKGLDNRNYYLLEHEHRDYRNFSGCGNTVNCNNLIVRRMILDCLRNWVENYHIDGFRFDLASILARGEDGVLDPNAPLVTEIARDGLLDHVKLIAEAWDINAYLVGSFGPNTRWAEWNGRYRDDVRRFWRGDAGTLGALATRLAGSSDLYERSGRTPGSSINFVTSHDGFTLNDLVSYRNKHNEDNGHRNQDGDDNNLSDNYGVEGRSPDKVIDDVRHRQVKNMLATLLMSQGVPMVLAGDECRRTQHGNNNAYCQDNSVSWFDWAHIKVQRNLVRFVRALIQFRRGQPTLRRRTFLHGQGARPEVDWLPCKGGPVDWHSEVNALACVLAAPPQQQDPEGLGRDLLMLFNATTRQQEFVLPRRVQDRAWQLFVDTFAAPPHDIFPELDGPPLPQSGHVLLPARSFRCYVLAS